MNTPINNTPSVEGEVCAEIMKRREFGLKKYGVGLERTDLHVPDWIQHAKEEALDQSLYLHRLGQDCIKYPTAQAVADHLFEIIEQLQHWPSAHPLKTELAAIARRVSVLQSGESQLWISVTERLPEHAREVLIYNNIWSFPDRTVDFGFYADEVWHGFDGMKYKNGRGPTHWMPLPNPPLCASAPLREPSEPEAAQVLDIAVTDVMSSVQHEAIHVIIGERVAQQKKWGEQNHAMPWWMLILHEETGELSEALLHERFGGHQAREVFTEAVQVAAVALQIVEYLIRQGSTSKPEAAQ